jgi:hypothetical protein
MSPTRNPETPKLNNTAHPKLKYLYIYILNNIIYSKKGLKDTTLYSV